MARLKKLKRDMLRGVVDENQRLRSGTLAPPPRRATRSSVVGRLVLTGVLGAVLLVLVGFLTMGGNERAATGAPAGAAPAGAVRSDAVGLQAPKAVDPALFNLAVRRIVLDPGHGGSDPGAETESGLVEKEVTLDISLRLRELLRGASFEVVMTREGDVSRSLRERALLANSARGDVFVSIHVNSIPRQERRGVETYFLGPTDDPHVNSLAAAENRDSGYSLHDFRNLLEMVYVGVRQKESRSFAASVQSALVHSLAVENPEIQDRGVKSAPFVVLVATEMPGILAEVSCISNPEEVNLLRQPEYRQRIARALFDGITNYAAARTRAAREGA